MPVRRACCWEDFVMLVGAAGPTTQAVDHCLPGKTPLLQPRSKPSVRTPMLQVRMFRSHLVHLACLARQLQSVALNPHLPPQLQHHLSMKIPPLSMYQGADQGYGIQPWIMTPFANPSTAAERAYNEAHQRARTIVERTFGILKSRFRCLDITRGTLLYSPEIVCKIILTCAILHNICVRSNIPLYEPDPQMPEEEDAVRQHEGDHPNTAAGLRWRKHIVQNLFEL
ncbi:putative nuclease HARBI1 [Pleurodeles waltl]|uniref:putative nuclease HARBI1 n=1 Tax=Pleurodeles waltl TaxID=8319 RepID=UPI00370978A3